MNNSVRPLFLSQTILHDEQIVGQGSGFLCILLAGKVLSVNFRMVWGRLADVLKLPANSIVLADLHSIL